MSPPAPYSLLDPDPVLKEAGRRRAEFVMSCAADLRAHPWAAYAAGPLRWLALGGAALICMGLVAHDGNHGVPVVAAVLLAALASSIAGFAFSAICGAMLFHLTDDPVQAVQIMIVCSIANQAAMTWAARANIEWRCLNVFLAGGAIGLAVGVWVLLHANRAQYTHILGVFLLVYGAYMLLRRPIVIQKQHPAFDFGSGILGGVTGGAAGFPGAFVTIWCGMKGWDKTRQRAVFQPYILIMQVAALLAISLSRHTAPGASGFNPHDLLFIPASLLGTALGLLLYRRMSDRQFARAVNILLIVSGLSYVV
jgi:uncharacterized protein